MKENKNTISKMINTIFLTLKFKKKIKKYVKTNEMALNTSQGEFFERKNKQIYQRELIVIGRGIGQFLKI